jgi:hypothetical protein
MPVLLNSDSRLVIWAMPLILFIFCRVDLIGRSTRGFWNGAVASFCATPARLQTFSQPSASADAPHDRDWRPIPRRAPTLPLDCAR